MILSQRNRENIEYGCDKGALSIAKIIKLYNKSIDVESIAASLSLKPEYVNSKISDYESD